MKKILMICTMMLFTAFAAQAQRTVDRQTKQATSNNSDTTIIAFNSVPSHLKSLQVSVYKLTGTMSGKAYLQYTVNGTDWVAFDSLTVADQAINTKIIPVTTTVANSYRVWYVGGTQTSTFSFSYLVRKDE